MKNIKQENLYTPKCIRVFSGAYLNVFDIDPDLIKIEDIAHGLSNQCRFQGHTKEFYSVAQHCLWVSDNCSWDNKLAGLLHDASEAYLVDFAKPIKDDIKQYLKIEDSLMKAIAKKFGFKYPLCHEVKDMDKIALEFEWKYKVLSNKLKSMSHKEAEKRFISMFNNLTK